MKKAKDFLWIFIVLLFISSWCPVYGQGEPQGQNRVVLIIINRADYNDFAEMEHLKEIMNEGYLGLMNTRGAGSASEFKSYATLGWGTRAEANSKTAIFYNLDEENRSIYQRRTGIMPDNGAVINVEINRLIELNIEGEYGATPGALGEALKAHGMKAAVLGNSDLENQHNHSAAFIAMDKSGLIPLGDVSQQMLIEDSQWPYGIRTNYEALITAFQRVYQECALVVIETGDYSRYEAYKSNLNAGMAEHHRKNVLEAIDSFLSEVIQQIDEQTLLLVVSPYPSQEAYVRGARLSPVVYYQKGQRGGGVLTSGTTRREGIISNTDIAPTILQHLGLSSDQMTGRPMRSVERPDGLSWLTALNSRVVNLSQQRYRVLYSFAIYEMLVTIVALILLYFRKRITFPWAKGISFFLFTTMVVPLSFLLLPFFGEIHLVLSYGLLIIVTGMISLLISKLSRGNPIKAILLVNGILLVGILLDICTGQHLMKHSLLGYDPIIGARYYGIGNEYAGVLLGCTLVFVCGLKELYPRYAPLLPLLLIVVVLLMGIPALGANVGGTITAIAAFLLTYLRLKGVPLNLKVLGIICLSVVVGIALLAVVDLLFLEEMSHLGGAIKQIYKNGFMVIPQIITRKISMNLKLMGVTIWSKVLLLALAVVGMLFYRPVGILKPLQKFYPNLVIGWGGIVVACGVGFAVNDSGVVFAATAAVFLSASILYLVFEREDLINEK